MRWSIVRLIWARELRDQLRDRRTVFMIAVLPLLLYPALGFGILSVFAGHLARPNVVGVQGVENLPPWPPRDDGFTPLAAAAIVAPRLPSLGTPLAGLDGAVAAAALDLRQHYPPLFGRDGNRLFIPEDYLDSPQDGLTLQVQVLPESPPANDEPGWMERIDRRALDERRVDLLLVVPPNFLDRLRDNEPAALYVLARPDDDRSRLVDGRMTRVLQHWRRALKGVRLWRKGLSPDFDEPLEVRDPTRRSESGEVVAEGLIKTLLKIFPFVLVMWSLAGALYPAVDLCAGEKERGTMETLLISPAGRAEIVWGKFLTIWVFSAATALLNLLSMGITAWQFGRQLPLGTFHGGVLLWGVALLLPLSAFFSALSLAIGAYARSSKEGQYYLMPLFLITMPLIFLTLAPGVELNAFYSMVPVTGVALLLQKLMIEGAQGQWGYFVPVLAPMVIYSWLALRWAIDQFQREEVLFREAERLDFGLWLRRLWRDKEALPSGGEALFCFGAIVGLQWLSLSLAGAGALAQGNLPRLLQFQTVRYLAFVAAPPLFMALLLTRRPLQGLALRRPKWWSWPAAALLAVLLLPPVVGLTLAITELNPGFKQAVLASTGAVVQPEVRQHFAAADRWQLLLVLGVVPAVCEELAFRGFILSGLLRRFRPWKAMLLSSFLFALYQMNVFQFVPHFVFGVVLALLVQRTGSVGPAVLFHLVWNLLLLYPAAFAEIPWLPTEQGVSPAAVAVMAACMVLAAPLLWAVARWETRHEEGSSEPLPPPPASAPAKELSRQAP
jgi:sodium transport system permease protein